MTLYDFLRTIFVGYFDAEVHFSHHPGRAFCGAPFLVRPQNFYEALGESGPPDTGLICEGCLNILRTDLQAFGVQLPA